LADSSVLSLVQAPACTVRRELVDDGGARHPVAEPRLGRAFLKGWGTGGRGGDTSRDSLAVCRSYGWSPRGGGYPALPWCRCAKRQRIIGLAAVHPRRCPHPTPLSPPHTPTRSPPHRATVAALPTTPPPPPALVPRPQPPPDGPVPPAAAAASDAAADQVGFRAAAGGDGRRRAGVGRCRRRRGRRAAAACGG